MIFCKELNKNFESKQEMFKALREEAKNIIDFKKKQIYKSVEKGSSVKTKLLDPSKVETIKADLDDDNYYYIVTNTTKILDSHTDLHIDGLWNRTANNQSGKNYLVDTHELSISATIARKEDVEILVQEIPFSMLGYAYSGNTQALIYKIPKDKIIDQKAKNWLDSNDDIEASVRMKYVQIVFAMNSDDPEDEFYKNNFNEFINEIANKEEYEEEYGEIIYFWVVKEAKNVDESSLVLRGSNYVTGNIKSNPLKSTSKQKDPAEKARLDKVKNYLSNKNY